MREKWSAAGEKYECESLVTRKPWSPDFALRRIRSRCRVAMFVERHIFGCRLNKPFLSFTAPTHTYKNENLPFKMK